MENKEQLINPPKDQAQMVAKKKVYKLFALQPFMVGAVDLGPGGQVLKDTSRIVNPGEIVEIDDVKKAKELCRKIKGPYAFSGERHIADKDVIHHDLTRARLATEQDMVHGKVMTPLDDELDL